MAETKGTRNGVIIDASYWLDVDAQRAGMGKCGTCGGWFPTRTSGITPGVTVCMSATQCAANVAAAKGGQ